MTTDKNKLFAQRGDSVTLYDTENLVHRVEYHENAQWVGRTYCNATVMLSADVYPDATTSDSVDCLNCLVRIR